MLTKTYFRRKLAQACGLGLVLFAAVACAPQQNVLTKEEVADGWQLLFDGKTLDQWKDYNGEEMVDITDARIGAAQGRIALQIHDGGGIKVLWRNFRLTTL